MSFPEDNNADPSSLPYPLITGRDDGRGPLRISANPPKSREVEVLFQSTESAVTEAVELADEGGAVLWVCDTINSAQSQYQILSERTAGRFPVGLLHSRFPFWRREELEKEWMERLGKNSTTRCGSILVSTQIVEQSVDLDADLLITELAPTDMLLQRMGRLWRHKRKGRPLAAPRFRILKEEKSLDEFERMEKKDIMKALGGKAYVYAPFVLLRTLKVWNDLKRVSIPSQIRGLIEATYAEGEDDPTAWQELFDKKFGKNLGEKFLAARNCNLWQAALEDEEGVQTRLNEIPTLSLVLCHSATTERVVLFDGSKEPLGGDEFRLATAQAIHRNLVKVALHHFESPKECEGFELYLHGAQTIGLVHEDGSISVRGLKNGVRLLWSNALGLAIEKASDGEEE